MPTDGENFAQYQEMLDSLEQQKAEDYAEAGTLPPGVVTRNPDTTTPEANYVSRDNIVVSGASPHNVQAGVLALATDESRDRALDAADVAQAVSREDYDAAVLASAVDAPKSVVEDAPSEVADLRDDDPSDEGEPRASGGAQISEDVIERVKEQAEDDETDGEPFQVDRVTDSGSAGASPELHAERGNDAVETDGKSEGESDPSSSDPDVTTR
jgi:hypothetical protein